MQVGSVIRRRVTNRGGTREERGRLKTQDYTRLRDSINGMYKASRAREAQLIDLFLADTLDVDDFLRLKNRNANAPKVAYQVCIDHERTWDKEPVGIKFRDRIEVNGPRVDEPWVQWTAAKFEGKVGVSPTQFLQICEQHKLIPLKIEGKNRSACTREFGIFLVLRRFRLMEGSFRDLSIELNAHRTRLQYLYAATIILYEVHYTDLATKVDVFRLAQPGALERLAKASMDVGAPYSHIIAYIDGKPVFTTRPGNRACKHQALQYNGNDIDVQKLFYTGYYHGHGIRLQFATFTDGIAIMTVDSLREHDQHVLNKSKLAVALRCLLVRDSSGKRVHPAAYGDPAYRETEVILRKHKGLRTTTQAHVDKKMQTARACAEDMFCTLAKTFKYFDNKNNFKILTRGQYTIAQELLAATILLNCFAILHGNQTTGLFKLDPPSLRNYFRDANAKCYVDY